MSERPPAQESLEELRARVLCFLKRMKQQMEETGRTDPEAMYFLNKWLDVEEAKVKDPRGQIELILKRGRLYLGAGFREEATAEFNDAAEHAVNQRTSEMDKVYRDICAEAAKEGLYLDPNV